MSRIFYVGSNFKMRRQEKSPTAGMTDKEVLAWFEREQGTPAEQVIRWLERGIERNGDKTRIVALLDLLEKLDSEIKNSGGRLNPRVFELEKEMARSMERYRTRPTWLVDHRPRTLGRLVTVHVWVGGTSNDESQMLRCIENVVNAGKLVVRCARCGKWFYRERRSFRWCSERCRRAEAESKQSRQERKRLISKRSNLIERCKGLRAKVAVATGEKKRALREKLQKAERKLNETERKLNETRRALQ